MGAVAASRLEHDPEKWEPVFPRDKREAFARRSCSNEEGRRFFGSRNDPERADPHWLKSLSRRHDRGAQVVVLVAGAFSADCMPVVGSVRMVFTCALSVPVSVKLESPIRNELLVEMKTR